MSRTFGYARISTAVQDLQLQLECPARGRLRAAVSPITPREPSRNARGSTHA